jgi:hypothetical protein
MAQPMLGPGMANARNMRGEIVCPLCARPFKTAESAMRVEDRIVHVECVEDVEDVEESRRAE